MLQRIQDSLQRQKWLALLIVGVLGLVFAAWGAYGIVDIGVGSGDYAAKVEGQKISASDARDAWIQQQAQLQERFGGEMPREITARLQDQLLESMVREVLLGVHAHDLGYRVSDAQLHDEIRRIPAFQIEGKYSPDAARYALAQAGMSLPAFESTIRRELQRAQIEGGIRVSDFLTPREIGRLQALESQQREVQYAVLPTEKFAGNAPVDDAAVQGYYAANQAHYMTPEFVKLAYGELRLDQVATEVAVSDAELHEAYEKSKDKYVQLEKRHLRHILIETGKDDAAALKKAQDVLAQAKSGGDFAALAQKYSQDPGSASKGGDLGWAERGSFDKSFADAAFAMKQGDIAGPVKSQYGYHIIQLVEVQPGKTQTFDEARAQIESELRRDKAADRFGDIQEQLQQKMETPGADLDVLVKEFNLQAGVVEQFERGKGGAPLGESPDLEQAAFSTAVLDEHRVGGPVALGEDRLVIVKALEHHQPAPKPLATVREEVVAAIRKEHGDAAALKAAEAARAKLESGTAFAQVAKELGVTVEPARYVGRNDPSVPAPIRDLVFGSPKPAEGKSIYRAEPLDSGGAALVAVTAVRQDPSPNAQLQAQQRREALANDGQSAALAYMDELRRKADVSKNPNAFE